MIKLICAHDKNRAIGYHGKMPWHFPEDLKYFKETTVHHPVVMGRKTFESIGKALPNRKNIVLSRHKNYHAEGCIVVHSIEEALKHVNDHDFFVIGGQKLFEQMLPFADELYLTEIQEEFTGDAFFPEFTKSEYERTVIKTLSTPYLAEFCIYRKKKAI